MSQLEFIPQQREMAVLRPKPDDFEAADSIETLNAAVKLNEDLRKGFLMLLVAARGTRSTVNKSILTEEDCQSHLDEYLLGAGVSPENLPEARSASQELALSIIGMLKEQAANQVVNVIMASMFTIQGEISEAAASVAMESYIKVYDTKMKKAGVDPEKEKAVKAFQEEIVLDPEFQAAVGSFFDDPRVNANAKRALKRGGVYLSWDEVPDDTIDDEGQKQLGKIDLCKGRLKLLDQYRQQAGFRGPVRKLRSLVGGALPLPPVEGYRFEGVPTFSFFKSVFMDALAVLKGHETHTAEFAKRGEEQKKAVESARKKSERHPRKYAAMLNGYERQRAEDTGCVDREYYLRQREMKGLNEFLLQLRLGHSVEEAYETALDRHSGSSNLLRYCLDHLSELQNDSGWLPGIFLSKEERKQDPKPKLPSCPLQDYVQYREACFDLLPFEEKEYRTNLQIDSDMKGIQFETAAGNRAGGSFNWESGIFTCETPFMEPDEGGTLVVQTGAKVEISLAVGQNKKLEGFARQTTRTERVGGRMTTFPVLEWGPEECPTKIVRLRGSSVHVRDGIPHVQILTEKRVVLHHRLKEFVEGELEKPCIIGSIDVGVNNPLVMAITRLDPKNPEPVVLDTIPVTTDFDSTGPRDSRGEEKFSMNAVRRRRELLWSLRNQLTDINSELGRVRRDPDLSDEEKFERYEEMASEYQRVLTRLTRKDNHFRRNRVPCWGMSAEGFIFYDDLRSAQKSHFTRLRQKDGKVVKSRLPKGFNSNRLDKRGNRKKEYMHLLASRAIDAFEKKAEELGVEAADVYMENLEDLRVAKGAGRRHLNRALARTSFHGFSDIFATKCKERGHFFKKVWPEYTSRHVYEDGELIPTARGFVYNPHNNGEMSSDRIAANQKHYGVSEWYPGQFEPSAYGGEFICFVGRDGKVHTKNADKAAAETVFWVEFFRECGKPLPFVKTSELARPLKGWGDAEVKPRFGKKAQVVLVPRPISEIPLGPMVSEEAAAKIREYLNCYCKEKFYWTVEKKVKSVGTEGKRKYLLTDASGRFLPSGVYLPSYAFKKSHAIFVAQTDMLHRRSSMTLTDAAE